jgi:hypothetical protein
MEFSMLQERLIELKTALDGEEMVVSYEEGNLFYQTPRMRLDYQCFKEVVFVNKRLTKTRFKRLLLIFCGLNSEGKTVVFGVALIHEESKKDLDFAIKCFFDAISPSLPDCFLIERNSVLRKAFEEQKNKGMRLLYCSTALARSLKF